MKGRSPVAVAAATLVAIAGGFLACRQLVGIGDEPPGATTAEASVEAAAPVEAGAMCGLGFAGAPCEACVERSCCAEATACSGSVSCTSLEGCLSGCAGDPACRAACPRGTSSLLDVETQALTVCLASHCTSECNLACGGSFIIDDVDAAAACAQCVQQNACPQATACLTSPACVAWAYCTDTAHTPDVQSACPNVGDAGLATFLPLLAAARGSCPSCELGTDWSCAGSVQWPPYSGSSFDLQVGVEDGAHFQPVPGVTARLCVQNDPSCSPPLAQGTTGQDGFVDLFLDGGVTSFYGPYGYVDVSTPDAAADAAIFPEIDSWGFPLSVPQPRLVVSVASTGYVATVAQVIGTTLDPARAHVLVHAVDCHLVNASGVTVAIRQADAQSRCFYLANNVPAQTGATDATGLYGCLNVPVTPALIDVTETPAGFSAPVGHTSALVRAGTLTYVTALPTPP